LSAAGSFPKGRIPVFRGVAAAGLLPVAAPLRGPLKIGSHGAEARFFRAPGEGIFNVTLLRQMGKRGEPCQIESRINGTQSCPPWRRPLWPAPRRPPSRRPLKPLREPNGPPRPPAAIPQILPARIRLIAAHMGTLPRAAPARERNPGAADRPWTAPMAEIPCGPAPIVSLPRPAPACRIRRGRAYREPAAQALRATVAPAPEVPGWGLIPPTVRLVKGPGPPYRAMAAPLPAIPSAFRIGWKEVRPRFNPGGSRRSMSGAPAGLRDLGFSGRIGGPVRVEASL